MKKLFLLTTTTVALALAAGLSGCAHKGVITPIPEGNRAPENGANNNNNPNPGQPVPPPVDTTSGIAQTDDGKYSAAFHGTENRDKFKDDSVFFDFDSSTIKRSEQPKLQDVANYFKSNTSDALMIEGNCDERGTEKYNLALGDRRSLAVREYLATLGMDPARIHTTTFGAEKPRAEGHNEGAWKQNRRGDIILWQPK